MKKLFVYGTLKSDGPLHEGWMGMGAQLLSKYALTRYARLLNIGDKYPALFFDTHGLNCCEYAVAGELWLVPDNALEMLRNMEQRAGYQSDQLDVHTWAGDDPERMYVQAGEPDDYHIAEVFYMRASSMGPESRLNRFGLREIQNLARNYRLRPDYFEMIIASWNNNPQRGPGGRPLNCITHRQYSRNGQRPEE